MLLIALWNIKSHMPPKLHVTNMGKYISSEDTINFNWLFHFLLHIELRFTHMQEWRVGGTGEYPESGSALPAKRCCRQCRRRLWAVTTHHRHCWRHLQAIQNCCWPLPLLLAASEGGHQPVVGARHPLPPDKESAASVCRSSTLTATRLLLPLLPPAQPCPCSHQGHTPFMLICYPSNLTATSNSHLIAYISVFKRSW